MRRALLACLLAGCYDASNLACAVSCASDLSCPGGLQCGLSDHLCHAGVRECSEIDAGVLGAQANQDTMGGAVVTTATGGTGIGSQTPTQARENHYVGLIDNIRIWSVARAKADICADAAPNCR